MATTYTSEDFLIDDDFLSDIAEGGVFLFEEGDYDFSALAGSIVVANPTCFIGQGAGHTVIRGGAGSDVLFDVQSDFTLKDLTFENWNEGLITTANGPGDIDQLEIKDCCFSDIGRFVLTNQILSDVTPMKLVRMQGCKFSDCYSAVKLRAPLERVYILDNVMQVFSSTPIIIGTNDAEVQDDQQHVIIRGNIIKSVVHESGCEDLWGILCECRHAVIDGNILDTVKGGEVYTDKKGISCVTDAIGIYTKCRYASITNNTIRDVLGTAIAIKGNYRDYDTDSDDCEQSDDGSDVFHTEGYGIIASNNSIHCPDEERDLCQLSESDKPRMKGMLVRSDETIVQGNHIDNAYHGVHIPTSGRRNITVVDNQIVNAKAVSIYSQACFENLAIRGNSIMVEYDESLDETARPQIDGIRINIQGRSTCCASSVLTGLSIECNSIYAINCVEHWLYSGINFSYAGEPDDIPEVNGVSIVSNKLVSNKLSGVGKSFQNGVRFEVGMPPETVSDYRIERNDLGAAEYPILNFGGLNSPLIRYNTGFVSENQGIARVNPGEDSVTVNHGLSLRPARSAIRITPLKHIGWWRSYWVEVIGEEQFIIGVRPRAVMDTLIFNWRVDCW